MILQCSTESNYTVPKLAANTLNLPSNSCIPPLTSQVAVI